MILETCEYYYTCNYMHALALHQFLFADNNEPFYEAAFKCSMKDQDCIFTDQVIKNFNASILSILHFIY